MRRLAFQGPSFAGDIGAKASKPNVRPPIARRARPRRLAWRLWTACLAASGFATILALLSEAPEPSAPDFAERTLPLAPLPAWVEIAPADQIFALEAAGLSGIPKSYETRRHRTGGGRQDVLTFGGANDDAARLRITIYQVGEEAPPEAAFFVELARRAAEMGRAIARATQPAALPTRLGAFEAASFRLAGSAGAEAECLGFRMVNETAKFRVAGFACADGAESFAPAESRSALACLIDSLELAAPAPDDILAAVFAARELNSDTACIPMRREDLASQEEPRPTAPQRPRRKTR